MEENALLKQIRERHNLEVSALRLQRQLAEHNSALRQAKYALIERRNMISGANAGKIYTYDEQADIQTHPEKCGENCKPCVQRLEKSLKCLEISFEPGAYFENPSFFLNASAAAHNRRDRLNEAINQVEALRKQLPEVRQQLEERSGNEI